MDKILRISLQIFNNKSYKCIQNIQYRQIMTTPKFMKDAVEELERNPYYEKYAQKIAKLQQTSPEEFLSRIEARENEKQKPKFGGIEERQYSSLLEPKKSLPSTLLSDSNEESLNKIMKLDLVKNKSTEEIKKIWEQYHIQKDVIAATIPAYDYDIIIEESKKYPTFLFPVPRSQGYEFIMCQFDKNHVHFTPLLYYQVHKENAPECLTITHFDEFKDNKGIVLMRGEFDKNVLNAKEAQCLANQLQLFYTRKDSSRMELLERFTKRPDEFKHIDLIKTIETLSL
ncbi:ATP synthase mitochondrial F1 complex assembly factor 1 isoform X2 [Agrilus planipennis]|uniref:ATP synthase mitochondrial F1 complex assembly factor 1 isoform X2 n=1 Tax=Agrilus planipennis TaxID=224129 RepID=A0A1W4WJ94_AGRPL|nr:ATP synthase mitochondrial F1 complex assembly factor 1 isoform X2 [Agrilus planipennis]